MSINSVANTTIPAATSSVTSTPSTSMANATQNKDDFIKLLVAQVKNQDPTKPITSSDMTAQMSQLNMVDGINQLNTTMSGMAGSIKGNDAIQAASLIGRSVLVPGTGLQLVNGSATMGVQLGQAADDVQVNILDSTGSVINSQNLGSMGAGLQNLTWDGTTNTGTPATNPPYTFSVTATQGGSALPDSSITPLIVATVNNVAMSGGVTSLNVTSASNSLSNVALSDVYEVIN